MRTTASPRRGAALLTAVFAIALMSLLILAYVQSLTAELQIVSNLQLREQARAIADAGIEDAIVQLRSDSAWASGFSSQEYPSGSGNTYTVTVANAYPVVTLTSTGTVGSVSCQIEARVVVSGAPLVPSYPVRVDYWKEIS